MSALPAFLAIDNPLNHVLDAPIGEGYWHHGDGSALESLALVLKNIGFTKHTFMFLLAGVLTLLFFWSYSRRALKSDVPGRWGNFVEVICEFIRDQVTRPFMGTAGDKFLPFVVTFFVFIATCNLLGLIPLFDYLGHGGNTATANLGFTGALAFCSFVGYHTIGVREQGNFFLYVKNLFPHVPAFILPLMVVIELVAHIIRPCALAIRLFANMLAGHTMVAAIIGFTAAFGTLGEGALAQTGGGLIAVISTIAVTLLTFLELLVAFIQAFVFTFLTTVFLSMAVHPEH